MPFAIWQMANGKWQTFLPLFCQFISICLLTNSFGTCGEKAKESQMYCGFQVFRGERLAAPRVMRGRKKYIFQKFIFRSGMRVFSHEAKYFFNKNISLFWKYIFEKNIFEKYIKIYFPGWYACFWQRKKYLFWKYIFEKYIFSSGTRVFSNEQNIAWIKIYFYF